MAIKRLRAEVGISSAELAKRTGLSRSYISYVEGGRFKDIGIERFTRIATALQVTPDQLLREAGYLAAKEQSLVIQTLLRRQLGLKGTTLEQAMEFLRFLTEGSPSKRTAR